MSIQYFLRVDDIDGDSTRVGFEGAVDVVAWSWGVSQPGAGGQAGGGATGRAEFDELQVVVALGGASPRFAESCATGRHHAAASLVGVRIIEGEPVAFLRYECTDVVIVSVEHSAGDDEHPSEELALRYGELTITTTADGSSSQSVFSFSAATNSTLG